MKKLKMVAALLMYASEISVAVLYMCIVRQFAVINTFINGGWLHGFIVVIIMLHLSEYTLRWGSGLLKKGIEKLLIWHFSRKK